MNNDIKKFKSAIIEARNSVNTHFVFQVFNVSQDGRFVDIVCNHLVWEYDSDSEQYVINSFNEEIPASPMKPEVLCDVPVKQFREGDLIIRKRPKVGDVGYIECFYQDISTWKKEGGFQAPISINIHDKSSCLFVNGMPNHKESDADPLPAENITQIKTKDISIEWQDTTDDESEKHIKVKSGNIEYELKEITENGETSNTVTFKTKSVTFQITDTSDGANVTMSVPDNITLTATKVVINGETEFNGNNTINGETSFNGNNTITGDSTIDGKLDVSDEINSDSDITATGEVAGTDFKAGEIRFLTHKHPGVTPGPSQTGTPV